MSKYVPPNMREKKEEQPPAPAPSPNEFPSLVNSRSSAVVWGGKKFSQVASEMEEKRLEEERQKMVQENEEKTNVMINRFHAPLPRFHNVGHFVEPEEEEVSNVQEEANDGWTLVDKKPRREKTAEEKLNRPPTPEESTVWQADNDEFNENCWEERH
jgi:hypothetical protein